MFRSVLFSALMYCMCVCFFFLSFFDDQGGDIFRCDVQTIVSLLGMENVQSDGKANEARIRFTIIC